MIQKETNISVIIPTFRRHGYLKKALESVLSQVGVTFEVLIINDDPNDNSLINVVRTISVKKKDDILIKELRNKANVGPGLSRMKGLQEASGQYIVFMDDDDYYTDKFFFLKATAILDNDLELSFVGYSSANFSQKLNKIISYNNLRHIGKIDRIKLLYGFGMEYEKPTSTFTSLFRKSMLDRSGLMNTEMVNDTVIYTHALLYGTGYYCNEVIGNYRIHSENITKNITEKFIIQNIEEKRAILGKIPLKGVKKGIWLYRQSWCSIEYYIYNHRKSHYPEIKNWVKQQKMLVMFLLTYKMMLTKVKLFFKRK